MSPNSSARATPGNGVHGGRIEGIDAAHFALQILMEAAITPDGALTLQHLESSMNMDYLNQTINAYATTDLPTAPNAQLAFLCNAFNANALEVMSMLAVEMGGDLTSDEPYQRVQLDGSTELHLANQSTHDSPQQRLDAQPIRLANETMTLGDLRDKRILGLGDPRALASLVSMDRIGAGMPRKALLPRHIDTQLDNLCAQWVNVGSSMRLENNEVLLCPTLAHAAGAFDGQPFGDVVGFLRHYAQPGSRIAQTLQRDPATSVRSQ